jgi:hypothetical protein
MFNIRSFSNMVMNPSVNPNTFMYKSTEDTIADILVVGYFDDMHTLLQVGDLIQVFCKDAATYTRVTVNENKIVTLVRGEDIAPPIEVTVEEKAADKSSNMLNKAQQLEKDAAKEQVKSEARSVLPPVVDGGGAKVDLNKTPVLDLNKGQ